MFIYGIDLDIMVAPIPYQNIPMDLNLTNYENKEIILNNLEIINKLINTINSFKNIEYTKSVLMLNGYRIAYREKFFLIEPQIRNKFTNLLRAVKLWAKSNK
uniref:Uncharacterized protein n=1 Tax=Meloidogyne hapla TaxID=6305 RepID=A0A1I8B9Q5_MELHA